MSTSETGTEKAPGLNRTDLQQHDLGASGREIIQNGDDIGRRRRPSATSIWAKRSQEAPEAFAQAIVDVGGAR